MITQGQCTVFNVNCLKGLENFAPGSPYVYKIALYTALADLDANTLTYTTVNEIVGTGYTAGGNTLAPVNPTSSGNTAFVSFANVTWNPANFTAAGALIYNADTNAAVCVLSFGSDKTATSTFTITFPAATSTTAVIRLN